MIKTDKSKIGLISRSMTKDEHHLHENLLLIVKEANETFNGKMLEKHLAANVKMTAQHIWDDMEGKEKVAPYFIGRFKFFEEKKDETERSFEKGYVNGSYEDQPCIVLSLNGKRSAYICLDVDKNGQISGINTITEFPPIEKVRIIDQFSVEKIN